VRRVRGGDRRPPERHLVVGRESSCVYRCVEASCAYQSDYRQRPCCRGHRKRLRRGRCSPRRWPCTFASARQPSLLVCRLRLTLLLSRRCTPLPIPSTLLLPRRCTPLPIPSTLSTFLASGARAWDAGDTLGLLLGLGISIVVVFALLGWHARRQ
jgi:hypothetical protein